LFGLPIVFSIQADGCLIFKGGKRFAAESGKENILDQLAREHAPAAVAEQNPVITRLRDGAGSQEADVKRWRFRCNHASPKVAWAARPCL
jgi:hypothetical protein